ncbi:MAG: restriction endonuclease subunit S [Desulfosalsimonadaceae bacterium]
MNEQKKVPKGWRWAKLGDRDVAEIGAGNSAPQGLEYFEGGRYPFVRTQDVGREGKTPCLLETTDKLNDHALKTKTLRLWPESTILIPKSGASTFLNHRAMLGSPAYVSSHLATVVPQKSVLPEYLYFFSLTVNARDIAPKNDYPSLRLPDIGSVEIPLPQLPVQERIVEMLQQADSIRRKRSEARRLADQILPALFLDMFGEPISNPKHWPVEPIGNLLSPEIERVTPAKAFPNDEFTYIEIAHIDNTQFRIVSPKKIFGRDAPSRARQVVRAGDVLYSMTRPNLRNIAVVSEEYDGAIATTGFAILRPKKAADTPFLFEIVKSPAFTNAMARFAEAKSLYPAIDEPEIRRFQILTPPSGFREQFATNYEFLSVLDSNTRQAGVESDMLFSNILSRAFTGELTGEWEAVNADWINAQIDLQERLPRLLLLALIRQCAVRAAKTTQAAAVLVTALMKYTFLFQMEGNGRRRFYQFIPYHYGPFAKELYDDLERLKAVGIIYVDNDTDEDKTRITLADPAGTDATLAELPEDLNEDVAAILDAYGDLDHNTLLKIVYEKYPVYAKKSRVRGRRE